VRLAQSPRELSSPVPHMRCAEFGQLWLNPIMSKDVADRGKGLHVFEAKTAGRVNRKTTPFTACQSEQKGVDSSEARIIYEWLIVTTQPATS
jgi:hypothetical protein